MCRLFRLLVLLAVVVSGVGFFRGWYSISTSGDDQTTSVNATIFNEKVREDVDRAKEKLKEFGHHIEGELEHDD